MPDKGVSKKGTATPAGMVVIASVPDFKVQCLLSAVLVIYLLAQTYLDRLDKFLAAGLVPVKDATDKGPDLDLGGNPIEAKGKTE